MGLIKTEEEQAKSAMIAAKIVNDYFGVNITADKRQNRRGVEAKMVHVFLCDMMRLSDSVIGESYARGYSSVFKHRISAVSLMNTDKWFDKKLSECEEKLIKHFKGNVPFVKRTIGMNDRRLYHLYMQLCENIPDGYETFFEVKILQYVNSLKEEIGLNGRIKIRPYKLRDERVARFDELAVRELDRQG